MPQKLFSTISRQEKLLRGSFALVSSWWNSEPKFAIDCRKVGRNLRRGAEFRVETEIILDSPLGAAGEWWGPTPPPPARFGLGWACGEHPEPGAATPTPPYLPTDLEANTTCCTSPNYLQAGAKERERERARDQKRLGGSGAQPAEPAASAPLRFSPGDLCVLSCNIHTLFTLKTCKV